MSVYSLQHTINYIPLPTIPPVIFTMVRKEVFIKVKLFCVLWYLGIESLIIWLWAYCGGKLVLSGYITCGCVYYLIRSYIAEVDEYRKTFRLTIAIFQSTAPSQRLTANIANFTYVNQQLFICIIHLSLLFYNLLLHFPPILLQIIKLSGANLP